MPALILHHYPMSPFSEKIRAMLGYTGLSWQSVITREMPPRPQLALLAGGYRKIPVAQIGADIFCDTRTIAAEIARLANRPELALEHCPAEVQAYAGRVDLQVFLASILSAGSLALGRKIWQSMSPQDVARLLLDRIRVGRSSSVGLAGILKSRPKVHLADVEQRLTRPFLFGDQPNHADFSTYHSLWFLRDQGESNLIDAYPRVSAWMDRIRAFGHGTHSEISAEAALEIAAKATPRAIAEEHRVGPLIGKRVAVAPSDYAREATKGVLVGDTPAQWILARVVEGLGTVHVHFPKRDFGVRAIDS